MIPIESTIKEDIRNELLKYDRSYIPKLNDFSYVPIRYLTWLKSQCIKVLPIDINLSNNSID